MDTISEEIAAAVHRELTGQKWATAVANAGAGNDHFYPIVERFRTIADASLRGVGAWLAREQAADWPGDLASRLGSASIILQAGEANAAERGDVTFAMQCGAAVKAVEEAKALVGEIVGKL
jgi:hypothetical protein